MQRAGRAASLSCTCAVALFALARSALVLAEPTATKVESPRVTSIKAYLFDETSGVLAPQDFLTDGSGGHWNDTTTGAMFVVVEVAGPRDQLYGRDGAPSYNVRLDAFSPRGSKALFTATRPIPWLREKGTLHVGFVFYPNRCSGVRLVAKVIGRGAGKPVEAFAAFACGE